MKTCFLTFLVLLMFVNPVVWGQAPVTLTRVEEPTTADGPAAFVVREGEIFAYAAQIARGVAGAQSGESVESALTRLFNMLAEIDTSVVVEFSHDASAWHAPPYIATDKFFRFKLGDSGTPTVAIPFAVAGPRGESLRPLFTRSATQPTTPTGVTITAQGVFGNLTSGGFTWDDDVPSGTNALWEQTFLINWGTTPPTVTPLGTPFPRAGREGRAGIGFLYIFSEARAPPPLPTGGSWDGQTFRAPSGWTRNSPIRSAGQNLYATGVELPSGGGAPHYTGVEQLNGMPGERGSQGLTGARGRGTELIFRVAATRPDAPATGSGTWVPATGAYTPPSGWFLDSSSWTGAQNLYLVKVALPGNSEAETYGSVFRGNGFRGERGERGAVGRTGGTTGSGEDGDSLAAIYKTSLTSQDNTILGVRPSGGAWNHVSNAFTLPAGWLSDIPDPLVHGSYVYMCVVTLHGEADTLDYDAPVQLTGFRGQTGRTGDAGSDGVDSFPIYRYAETKPISPANGQGQYFANPVPALTVTGWSQTVPATNPNNYLLWKIDFIYNPRGTTNAQRLIYGGVYQASGPVGKQGPVGERGATGARGNDGSGTGGNDGDSVTLMYQASTDELRSLPTGGSWVRATHTFTPPSGWYATKSGAETAGSAGASIYASVVSLSGTADRINAYSHPIDMTGERGQKGDKGDTGDEGHKGDKGDTGERGPVGPAGKLFIPIFKTAATKPSLPSPTRYDSGVLHGIGEWHQAPPENTDVTQRMWAAFIEADPATGTAVGVTVVDWQGFRGLTGKFFRPVYQWAVSRPADPSGLSYHVVNGTIGGLGQWREAPADQGASGEAQWMALIEIDGANATYIFTSRVSGPAGSASTVAGPAGRGTTIIFQRAAAKPARPANGTGSWNGSDYDAPPGWHESAPAGSNPLYSVYVKLSGTDRTNTGITYEAVVPAEGVDGADGAKGDSVRPVWRVALTPPSTPTGLAINASGVWTDLVADNGNAWRADPVEPSGNLNLYRQDFEVDWAGPTLTALGSPFREATRGIQGLAGRSVAYFYLRTTTSATPTTPSITFNGSSFGGLGSWIPNNLPGGSGAHVWRVVVSYQAGVNGQQVTNPVEFTAQRGERGLAADRTVPIFQLNTAVPTAAPVSLGSWDGTTFTPAAGWNRNAPSPTQTQYVVMLWVQLTSNAPYTIQYLGNPQISSVKLPAGVAPPATVSVQLTYGRTNTARTPSGSALTTSAVQLASGGTHTFTLDMPLTTAANQYFYITAPAGVVLTDIEDSVAGAILDDWTRVGQTWYFGPLSRARTTGRYGVTLRRN